MAFWLLLKEQLFTLNFQKLVSTNFSEQLVVAEVVQNVQRLLRVRDEDTLFVKAFQYQTLDEVSSQRIFLLGLILIRRHFDLQKL